MVGICKAMSCFSYLFQRFQHRAKTDYKAACACFLDANHLLLFLKETEAILSSPTSWAGLGRINETLIASLNDIVSIWTSQPFTSDGLVSNPAVCPQILDTHAACAHAAADQLQLGCCHVWMVGDQTCHCYDAWAVAAAHHRRRGPRVWGHRHGCQRRSPLLANSMYFGWAASWRTAKAQAS